MRPHAWTAELRDTEHLLRADCLLAGEKTEETFSVLNEFLAPDAHTVDEIVRRLRRLIERKPDKRYFSLGAALLAGAKRTDAAESLISKGCGVLDPETALDLNIEFGEILYHAGNARRGEHIFAEALAAATNRRDVLTRIERASAQWAERERATLGARLEAGTITEEETLRLAALALDEGRPADALTALARSTLRGAARSLLLGRAYLDLDRPALALAALGSSAKAEYPDDATRWESLYLEGLASETIGDHGRATAAFSAIAAADGAYRDARDRAAQNYTKFLESRCTDAPIVLEKTDSIERS